MEFYVKENTENDTSNMFAEGSLEEEDGTPVDIPLRIELVNC